MEYTCKIGTDAGLVLTQTEQARSEEELRQRLRAQGYLVFSVRPKSLLSFQFKSPRVSGVIFVRSTLVLLDSARGCAPRPPAQRINPSAVAGTT